MSKEILHIAAIDKDGNLVHINDAKKGKTYNCPSCKEKFILRKSGKTGKGSKRPHFAHNELTTNCTPESALHYSFKRKLIDFLIQYLSENRGLIVNWSCSICTKDYTRTSIKRNLLEKAVQIREEYDLQVCRPDIALLDKDEKVIAAIEIVVTHAPEENTINYYKENGITLIQLNLQSEEDLFKIKEKITNPDRVSFCLIPNCPAFDFHKINRKLAIGFVRCRICGSAIKSYRLEVDSVFGKMNTDNLTERELTLLAEHDVQMKVKTNKLTGINIPIIKCISCERRNKIIRSKYNRRRF
tara:strand:+ start:235 stop:1131 length:897 start_codon:yes stop_codon:yes gene_type:complete